MLAKVLLTVLLMGTKDTTQTSPVLDSAFETKILQGFEHKVRSNKKLNTGLLLIHSPSLNIHWKTAAHHDPNVFVHPHQPYHFASIGKTVTSVMIGILYEKGLVDYDDYISTYLDDSIMNNLHMYKGKDYSDRIKIRHLLNHTSGLPDTYLDRNKEKVRLLDRMIAEPNRFWTPIETIAWSKQELKPKFEPGNGFHYSDPNYQLLGLIIEKVTGLPLHEAYQQYIFAPLEMHHSYLNFYSKPSTESEYPLASFVHNGVDLVQAQSSSMSWASGGIISTSEDMLKFIKAIVTHQIIGSETLNKMQDFAKMGLGLKYGYGIMSFHFLLSPSIYDIWGNSGSIGAFMYYNPAMDLYMIGSFHKLNYQSPPIFFIYDTLKKFHKQLKKDSL